MVEGAESFGQGFALRPVLVGLPQSPLASGDGRAGSGSPAEIYFGHARGFRIRSEPRQGALSGNYHRGDQALRHRADYWLRLETWTQAITQEQFLNPQREILL